MKLTKNDIAYLRKIGYNDYDIKEIVLGDYLYFLDYVRKISQEETIRKLGRKCWLSGIARARFHASSVRRSKNGKYDIYFSS